MFDVDVCRRLNFRQEADGRHDLAGLTVATLDHVISLPNRLNRLRDLSSDTFDRRRAGAVVQDPGRYSPRPPRDGQDAPCFLAGASDSNFRVFGNFVGIVCSCNYTPQVGCKFYSRRYRDKSIMRAFSHARP